MTTKYQCIADEITQLLKITIAFLDVNLILTKGYKRTYAETVLNILNKKGAD